MAVTLDPANTSGTITLSGGNLTASIASSSGFASSRSTHAAASGKYYFEATLSSGEGFIGVGNSSASISTFPGATTASFGWWSSNDSYYYNGATSGVPYDSVTPANIVFGAGSTVGILVDVTNRKMQVTVDGTHYSDLAFAGAFSVTGDLYVMVGTSNSGATTLTVNFGDSAWAFSLPSGYTAFSSLAGGGGAAATPRMTMMGIG